MHAQLTKLTQCPLTRSMSNGAATAGTGLFSFSKHTVLGLEKLTGISISCKGAQQQHSAGQQAPSSTQECGLQALQSGLDLIGAQQPVPGQHLWRLHKGLAIIPASAFDSDHSELAAK